MTTWRVTRRGVRVVGSLLGWGLLVFARPADAATYTMAPGDSWSAKLAQLQPGDTLLLQDGTYGPVTIDCDANASDGTAAAPITLRAEHERQAFIAGDGNRDATLSLVRCDYWIIEGLHVEAGDADNQSVLGYALRLAGSSNNILRRNLLARNNRYLNSHLLGLEYDSNSNLVEENEFYMFHRHAVLAYNTIRNTIRRNYSNSRGYPDLPGGYPSGESGRGDSGIAIYPGSNNILENNISENTSDGFTVDSAYWESHETNNNGFFGNMALNCTDGWYADARNNTLKGMPQNTVLRDNVAVRAGIGFRLAATKNTRCSNCSAIGGGYGFYANVEAPELTGDGAPSVYFENALAVSNANDGFLITQQSDWLINYGNASDNGTNYSPNDAHVTNSASLDPRLGACKVWIPDGSPMKGAGKDGADIGANILYRYENGVLTTQPLWDLVSGKFPCGAIVPGLNDIAGSSCFDVHQRLNVNTNGCSFPQGYGAAPLRGDLTGDGKRDLADVRLLIYMLIGQQATTPEAELTGDGAVTLADLQALIKLMVGVP